MDITLWLLNRVEWSTLPFTPAIEPSIQWLSAVDEPLSQAIRGLFFGS